MRRYTGVFQGLTLAFLICGTASATDLFDNKTPFSTTYDFYIGGLPIATISLNGEIGRLGYNAKSEAKTRGILDLIISGRLGASVKGYRHTKGHLAPDTYKTSFNSRSNDQTINMVYASELAKVSITPPDEKKAYDTRASEHPGTLDPVTAAVTIMTPQDGSGLCNRTIPVFDGKRRYDIILLPKDERPGSEKPPSPEWKTPVTWCFGIYERIAGFEAKLQKEQRYFPFDVWFETTSQKGIHKIVRIAGKTRLGFAIGTLRP